MMQKKPSPVEVSRVLRSREQARVSYDRLSRWYDTLAASERRFTNAGVDLLAPAPGNKVLELGFGTGHALVRLARAVGATGQVYGVDLSAGMRGVAQRRLHGAGLCERVELVTADAMHLPLEAGRMNAIFLSFTLELFDTPEIPVVLAECRRVLTEDGRLCVVSMAADAHAGPAPRLYAWAHEHFPTVVDCRPILVAEALEAAGFHVMSCIRRGTWGLPLDICLAGR